MTSIRQRIRKPPPAGQMLRSLPVMLAWLAGTAALTGADHDLLVIPHGPDAPVAVQSKSLLMAHLMTTVIKPLRVSPDGPGKKEALTAIIRAADSWGGVTLPDDEIVAAAQAAIDAGSHDPMLPYVLARFDHHSSGAVNLQRYRDALAAFEAKAGGADYPPERTALAAFHIYVGLCGEKPVDQAALAQAAEDCDRYGMAALATLRDDDQGAVATLYDNYKGILPMHLLPGMTARMLHDLSDPRIPLWWRNTLSGWIEMDVAWHARRVWEESGTAADHQGFVDHMAKARDLITAAWLAHPERYQAPAEMIDVAMAGADPGTTPTQWGSRALAAEIDNDSIYRQLFKALSPQWGGSLPQMLMVGEVAADTGRYDTRVPGVYVEAVHYVYLYARMANLSPDILHAPAVWTRATAILDHIRADHPDLDVDLDASSRAVMAWECGRPADCLLWLDQIHKPVLSWFMEVGMSPEQLHAAATAAVAQDGGTPAPVPKPARRTATASDAADF